MFDVYIRIAFEERSNLRSVGIGKFGKKPYAIANFGHN
jgi:hypothetical protein